MCYQVIMAELCGMQIKVQVNLSKRYCCCFDQYRPSLSVLVIYTYGAYKLCVSRKAIVLFTYLLWVPYCRVITYGYCIKLIYWHSLEEKLLLFPFCKCYHMLCLV